MIGGDDFVISLEPLTVKHRRIVLQALREAWPNAVVRYADTDACLGIDEVPLDTLRELFVYRGVSAWRSWKCYGATRKNSDAMVNVFFSPSGLTVVTGGTATGKLAEEIARRLR